MSQLPGLDATSWTGCQASQQPVMQSDVLPLGDFNKQWTPREQERQNPVFVERVSLRDALRGGFPGRLLKPIELVEPTFQVLGSLCTLCIPVQVCQVQCIAPWQR